ncbi:AMIN-like domain-containing (lipo)protein [Ornithinimicrobium panacihumi]|uniref:AMIN-like domain-containing (lipo)protein n=1 Tax=Ornithinimicrobium panacihumi TaxID=2008449 RepID=UPI003F8AE293
MPQSEDETVEETSAEDGQETTDDAPEAPEDTGTSEVGAATIGDAQEITGVRTGTHDGFDRVVLDLTGDEVGLGWYAAFTDQVFHDPTGEPLDVAGQTYLQLGVRGIDWIVDSPERYAGDPVPGGSTVVEEVVFGGLFEGQQQIVLGLTEQTAYRVFALSDPSRIVIDVQHP